MSTRVCALVLMIAGASGAAQAQTPVPDALPTQTQTPEDLLTKTHDKTQTAEAAVLPEETAATAVRRFFQHPETHRFVPWQAPTPPPDPDAPVWPIQPNEIAARQSGWGWCSYIDKAGKKTYYSDLFFVDPNTRGHEFGRDYDYTNGKEYASSVDKTYTDYINAHYVGASGWAHCQWEPYTSEFLQRDALQSDEFAQQLQNYQIVQTPWQP